MFHQEGAGVYHGYIVQAPWLPAVQDGLENLSPLIARTQALNWLDINSMSRQSVSFDNTVRALPLDVDYVAIGWRQDVFDAHGKSPPETLEELAELSEYFNGRDHNGDGAPDWGFCLTPKTNYLMAFVAPFFQTTQRECRRLALPRFPPYPILPHPTRPRLAPHTPQAAPRPPHPHPPPHPRTLCVRPQHVASEWRRWGVP